MDMNIVTPPKKGLKTRPYRMDMNMDNNVATLPKKGLKKYDCNIYIYGYEHSDSTQKGP